VHGIQGIGITLESQAFCQSAGHLADRAVHGTRFGSAQMSGLWYLPL
jgi:hypothetical protein